MDISAAQWALWLGKNFTFLPDKEWYSDIRTNLNIIHNDWHSSHYVIPPVAERSGIVLVKMWTETALVWHAFSNAAAAIWNLLPENITYASVLALLSCLKNFLLLQSPLHLRTFVNILFLIASLTVSITVNCVWCRTSRPTSQFIRWRCRQLPLKRDQNADCSFIRHTTPLCELSHLLL